MTTYERTETVEAMQWHDPNHPDRLYVVSHDEIVAWVRQHSGDARYQPAGHSPYGYPWHARITVRTSTGEMAYAAPGDAIVMGDWICGDPSHDCMVRAFSVVPAAEWSSQGWRSK